MLASTITTVKARPALRSTGASRGRLGYLLLAAVLGAVFLPALLAAWPAEPPRRFAPPAPVADGGESAVYQERFIDPAPAGATLHTPALGALPGGHLLAMWKVGESGEGGPVALRAASLAPGAATWSASWPVTSSRENQRELGRVVRTLANPVLLAEPDGTVRVFYVTAWAKWSTSAVATKTSRDAGRTWSAARRIVAHPVGNLATLVKMAPVRFADGTVGIPAYHEFFGVFPQLLRVSPEGALVDKVRIGGGQTALQPSIVPLDDRRAVALLRNFLKGHVLLTRTRDGGTTWDPVRPIALPNPNAPVMGLRLRDGAVLVVFNNSRVSRDALSLAVSRDGGARWQVLHGFENHERMPDGVPVNFSYPYIVQAGDGVIHLVYVWRQRHVKHVAFNEVWLSERAR
jgi:predicted neuraminidase